MLGIFMVLLALLVTLARFGLPWVQEQRQALLNQLLPPQSFHTRVERLGLTWIDAGPALSLQGLELEPSTAAAWRLQVGEAKLQLAPWQSLLQRRWVVERLQLQKMRLSLPDSQLKGEEENSGRTAQAWRPIAELFLDGIRVIELQDCAVQVTSPLGKLSSLQIERVLWLNQQGHHRGRVPFAWPISSWLPSSI